MPRYIRRSRRDAAPYSAILLLFRWLLRFHCSHLTPYLDLATDLMWRSHKCQYWVAALRFPPLSVAKKHTPAGRGCSERSPLGEVAFWGRQEERRDLIRLASGFDTGGSTYPFTLRLDAFKRVARTQSDNDSPVAEAAFSIAAFSDSSTRISIRSRFGPVLSLGGLPILVSMPTSVRTKFSEFKPRPIDCGTYVRTIVAVL